MSERQALVEEAMKLIHGTGIEPIFKSLSSNSSRILRRGSQDEGGPFTSHQSPTGPGELSTQAGTEFAKPASRVEAEGSKAARRAEAEVAKEKNALPGRHDRKCSICRHRDRADIERDFLHWYSPRKIADEYGLPHHSAIYRHAHATGLFAQRATNLRIALGPIIEQCMNVSVCADNVIRAVVAFAHLNDQGEWVEPPRTLIHQRAELPGPVAPALPAPEAQFRGPEL